MLRGRGTSSLPIWLHTQSEMTKLQLNVKITGNSTLFKALFCEHVA